MFMISVSISKFMFFFNPSLNVPLLDKGTMFYKYNTRIKKDKCFLTIFFFAALKNINFKIIKQTVIPIDSRITPSTTDYNKKLKKLNYLLCL